MGVLLTYREPRRDTKKGTPRTAQRIEPRTSYHLLPKKVGDKTANFLHRHSFLLHVFDEASGEMEMVKGN